MTARVGTEETGTEWQGVADYLATLSVGRVRVGAPFAFVSLDDSSVQAALDEEPGVRALLDSPEGRAALLSAHAGPNRRAHLDGAAVRLSTPFGRDLTQLCSLALHDRRPELSGLHYRSRHDDSEDCWALYDRAVVEVVDVVPLSSTDPRHRAVLASIAALWRLPLPPDWR